jgi:hypothetical protein
MVGGEYRHIRGREMQGKEYKELQQIKEALNLLNDNFLVFNNTFYRLVKSQTEKPNIQARPPVAKVKKPQKPKVTKNKDGSQSVDFTGSQTSTPIN